MRETEGTRGTLPGSSETRRSTLLNRPPLVETPLRPEDVYSHDELSRLADWLKSTLPCRGKEGFEQAARSFGDAARAKVTRMLHQLREQGYYPEGVDEYGGIIWGVALKGNVQLEIERNANRYKARGEEIMAENGIRFAIGAVSSNLGVTA